MKVRIDIHEPKAVIELMRVTFRPPEYEVEVTTLSTGDICVGDAIAIERKNPQDFVASIGDGRLKQQAVEMREHYAKPFILVSGTLEDVINAAHGDAARIVGVSASLCARYGVPTIFAGDRFAEFASKLVEKGTDGKAIDYSPVRRGATSAETQHAMLSMLPGVGPKRAKALLNHYGGALIALNAIDSWDIVNGVGKGTRDRVKVALGLSIA